MKLTFIGSGSAFTVSSNFHANMLLQAHSGKKLLIDCGSDARWALAQLGFSHVDIEAVYISHLHADHSGGLEWLAFTTKFDRRCKKPRLYIHENLVTLLWENQLRGGLGSIENAKTTLDSYFDVSPLSEAFEWEGVNLEVVRTQHINDGAGWWPSYALFIDTKNTKVFITTDTQFFPEYYAPYFEKADIIFHDCETSVPPSGVHSSYADLRTLSDKIKSKMWLYHYNDGALPDAKADGFAGFVLKGQHFDL